MEKENVLFILETEEEEEDTEKIALKEAFRAKEALAAKWRRRQQELRRRQAIAEIIKMSS